MKKIIPYFIAIILLFLLGFFIYKNTNLQNKIDELSNPLTYFNGKHNYSLNFPAGCSSGPLLFGCKQNPPEKRPQNCLCFLNGEDANSVVFQSYTGPKTNLNLASAWINFFGLLNPGQNLVDWLKSKQIQNVPDLPNTQIAGFPGVKIYSPAVPQSYSMDTYFFAKDNQVFQIIFVDVDNQGNNDLYTKILSSLKFY